MSLQPNQKSLRELQKRWKQLTEIPKSPKTSMGIIQYSLGSQQQAEVYVNRLLRYLLDPEAPHGMDEDFLRAFLKALPSECKFQEDMHDLSDVRVRKQVQVGASRGAEGRSGDVDILIDLPNVWFLLIELKFGADEGNLRGSGLTQTEFYYDTDTIDGVDKEDYVAGHHYLYLHQGAAAKEPEFANWTWDRLLDDVVAPVLADNSSRYPLRTIAQLREFIDDIENITGMSDEKQNEREKVELYLDHRDAIEDVRNAFNDRWDEFKGAWGSLLATELEEDGLETNHEFTDSVISVDLPHDELNRPRFMIRKSSDDWGVFRKDGWKRLAEEPDRSLYESPEKGNIIRIHFHHRLDGNRDVAIDEEILKVYFRSSARNDSEFKEPFRESVQKRDIEAYLPASAEATGNLHNMIEATYEIRVNEHDDFFDAYIDALHRAFTDLVVENEELIAHIDDAFEEALTSVYR